MGRNVGVIHVYKYMYNACVADICERYMFYTCITYETPHIYWMCIPVHVVYQNGNLLQTL